jgi:hypothetical protein
MYAVTERPATRAWRDNRSSSRAMPSAFAAGSCRQNSTSLAIVPTHATNTRPIQIHTKQANQSNAYRASIGRHKPLLRGDASPSSPITLSTESTPPGAGLFLQARRQFLASAPRRRHLTGGSRGLHLSRNEVGPDGLPPSRTYWFLGRSLGQHFELLECSGLSCGNQRINALQSSFRNDDQWSLVSAFMTRTRPGLEIMLCSRETRK